MPGASIIHIHNNITNPETVQKLRNAMASALLPTQLGTRHALVEQSPTGVRAKARKRGLNTDHYEITEV